MGRNDVATAGGVRLQRHQHVQTAGAAARVVGRFAGAGGLLAGRQQLESLGQLRGLGCGLALDDGWLEFVGRPDGLLQAIRSGVELAMSNVVCYKQNIKIK